MSEESIALLITVTLVAALILWVPLLNIFLRAVRVVAAAPRLSRRPASGALQVDRRSPEDS